MPRLSALPTYLAKYGLRVEVVPGALTRGSDVYNPRASLAHWTAGGKGDRGSLQVCIDGRAGVPPPLCNDFLTRAGVAIVVACGRANSAGTGGWRGLVGNSSVLATEAENSGPGDPWTPAQRDAYPRVMAAHCDLMGRDASWVLRHCDWAPDRKIDINTWPLADLQARTQALLDAGGATDMVTGPEMDEIAKRSAAQVWATILQALSIGSHTLPQMSAAATLQQAALHAVVAGRATGVGDLALRDDVGHARDQILPVVQDTAAAVEAVAGDVAKVAEAASDAGAGAGLDYDRLAQVVAPLLARTVREEMRGAVREVLGSLDDTNPAAP